MYLHTAVLMMNEPLNSHLEAKGIIGDEGTSDCSHISSLLLPQTVVLKVIEAHCPWHLQCHPGRTTQMDLNAPDEGGGIEKKCV